MKVCFSLMKKVITVEIFMLLLFVNLESLKPCIIKNVYVFLAPAGLLFIDQQIIIFLFGQCARKS